MDQMKYLISNFLIFVSFIPFALCECNENMNWMREYTFGPTGNVTIKWNFTDDELTMIMIGKTAGWVALGFSLNKSLVGGDVVLGWIDKKTDKIFLQDRYGSFDNQVLMDDSNDYQLLGGEATETSTIICWKRKLHTCDGKDMIIKFTTYRVFWAIGLQNPDEFNFYVPENLGPYSGIQSLRLIGLKFPKPNSPDILTVDFTANNVTISRGKDPYLYWCTHFTIPKSLKKSHLVAFEPLIQKENHDIVHHYLFYECPANLMKNWGWAVSKEGYNCIDYSKFPFEILCTTALFAWAAGGEMVVFPKDIGYPFHSINEEKYFLIQTHYNVAMLKSTRIDNSGIRLYYTFNLRNTEASIMGIGNFITPFTPLIPPHQKDFTGVGICSSDCTKPTISDKNVNVFAVMLHAHLTAKKLSLKILRDGEEIEYLIDNAFDFDFQEMTVLPKELVIKPGDDIIVECVYDTTMRNKTTIGAFGTTDEMCLVMMFYTPPAQITWCVTYLEPTAVFNVLGIEAIYPLPSLCWGEHCQSVYSVQGMPNLLGVIMLPMKYNGVKLMDYIQDYKWNPEKVKEMQKLFYSNHSTLCRDLKDEFNSSVSNIIHYPLNFRPLKMLDQCNGATNQFPNLIAFLLLIFTEFFAVL